MDLSTAIESFGAWLLRSNVQASAVVLLVLASQWIFRRWLTPGWRYALWGLVLLRLVVPVLPQSEWSVFNAAGLWREAGRLPPAVTTPAPRVTVTLGEIATTENEPVGAVASLTGAALMDWRLFLLLAWLGGAIVVSLWTAAGVLRLRRDLRSASPAGAATAALLDQCRQAMRVRRTVRLAVTDLANGPAICGVIRPVILIPPTQLHELSPVQLRLIFLHELAHLKAWDLAVDWVCRLALIIHWFNPLLWLAWSRARSNREMARDGAALAAAGAESSDAYGQTILQLLLKSGPAPRTVGVAGIWEGRHHVKERIAMVARFGDRRRLPWVGVLLFMLLGCTVLTDAQSAQRSASPAAQQTQPAVNSNELAKAYDEVSGQYAQMQRAPSSAPAEPNVLDRRLPEVRFNQVALVSVLDFLRDFTGYNLYVNWRALEAAGVERDVPVSLRARDVTFGDALELTLTDAAGQRGRLGFRLQNNVIVISTVEDLASDVVTKVYDVRHLLGDLESSESLLNRIRDTVEPRSWRENGGSVGAIQEVSDQFVITQTPAAHEQVMELLEDLRAELHPATAPAGPAGANPAAPLDQDAAKRSGRTVTLEHRFVTFPPKTIDQLGGAPAAALRDPRAKEGILLSTAQHNGVLAAASEAVTLPRITVFSGQSARIGVQIEQHYISDYQRVRGEGGAVAYEPSVDTLQLGITIEAVATVGPDGSAAEVKSKVKKLDLLEMETRPWEGAQEQEDLTVQVPKTEVIEFERQSTLSEGQTLLVGPFRLQAHADKPERDLYTMITVSEIANGDAESR